MEMNILLLFLNQTILFDPLTSNIVDIKLREPAEVRFVQIIFYANTGATGGQIGELEIYSDEVNE